MEKKLYLLAEPDDNLQTEFKVFEKIITGNGLTGDQTKDIPYHITLSSYSAENEKYTADLLDKIKKEFSQVKISFSSLGLFGLNVLFFNPDMNRELIDIYNFTKEKSLNREEDLAAHATLLIDKPDNIIKILPEISGKFKKLEGKIRFISLYEFFPKRFIKRVELIESTCPS